MTLTERIETVKKQFFGELDALLEGYDKERILFDESYEISPEADAKLDELLDYSEEWWSEYFRGARYSHALKKRDSAQMVFLGF